MGPGTHGTVSPLLASVFSILRLGFDMNGVNDVEELLHNGYLLVYGLFVSGAVLKGKEKKLRHFFRKGRDSPNYAARVMK